MLRLNFSYMPPSVVWVTNVYCAPTFHAVSFPTSLGSPCVSAGSVVGKPIVSLMRLTLTCSSYAPKTYSFSQTNSAFTLYRLPNEPSVHAGVSAPLPGMFPPAQSCSADARLLLPPRGSLLLDRFWPGPYMALKEKPLQLGELYQIACGAR